MPSLEDNKSVGFATLLLSILARHYSRRRNKESVTVPQMWPT